MDSYGKYVPNYMPSEYHLQLYDSCFTELYAQRNDSDFKQKVTNCVIQNHRIAKTIREHLTKHLEHIPIRNFVYDFELTQEGVKALADVYDNSYMSARINENKTDEEE